VVKVSADREVCVCAGMCVMTAPEVFDQDDDGVVLLLTEKVPAGPEGSDAVQNRVRDAVDLCPSGALRLVDD
jgi:ferredoxin